MRRPDLRVLACVAILELMALPAAAESLPDIIDSVRPSVVGVGTSRPVRKPLAKGPPVRFLGTGFIVGDGNMAITNYHVVPKDLDSANEETIVLFAGRGRQTSTRQAKLLQSDPERDLALLSFSGPPLPALSLDSRDRVREGDAIAFPGFPIGVVLGLYPVTHRGIVSVITPTVIPANRANQLTAAQVKRMRSAFDVYQLDATAYPGNSGSPVYRQSDGAVIGVVNSVYVKETKEALLEKPSGITYAIPVSFARDLLEKAN